MTGSAIRGRKHNFRNTTIWICASAQLFFSCATIPRVARELAAPPAGEATWVPLASGIDYASWKLSGPRRQVRALRVGLDTPGLECVVTRGDGRPNGTVGRTTRAFAEEQGCSVAVNANPFSPSSAIDGEERTIFGLSVSAGELVSSPREGYATLIFGEDGRASIAIQDGAASISGKPNAVGGFDRVLSGGRIVGRRGPREPRTGAGVSAVGRVLYLIVIDGRQVASVGASSEEVGAWLAYLGASEGCNLDGGGSTTMVIRDGAGTAVVANSPVHGGWPGIERVVGNNLGFRLR